MYQKMHSPVHHAHVSSTTVTEIVETYRNAPIRLPVEKTKATESNPMYRISSFVVSISTFPYVPLI